MILKALVVRPFASNCFIVGSENTSEGMIIDPGGDAEDILSAVRQSGLNIVLIVATHAHFDHIAALKKVKEDTGAEFAMHEAEAKHPGLHQAITRMFAPLVGGSFGSVPEPDRLLQEGDVLEIGDLRFTVLHTPGHSPGGISLVGQGVVFSGDTLFNFGIGRYDFPGCSFDELMHSINVKLMALPDDTIVLPGHGPQTTIGRERQHNPFLHTG